MSGAEPTARESSDERMARILAGREKEAGQALRRRLQEEGSEQSEDVLERLNALDFVSSVVGESLDIPERLGDYKVTGLLGRGGMGTVYQAFQISLEREVALKVLSPVYTSDPTMRKRFRSEARATASLHHQHIVPIYDYGEAAGCLYFAMEKVDGISLDKHISAARRMGRPPMDPVEAARRFAGVADALGLAHRRRILHRDVKPGNILVAADGTMALADFGLSKILGDGSVRLTSKGGGFLGTLHYAAPEQAMGQELTPASDLYSLGVTIFEAVTGELPIAGKTTEAVLKSILHGTPKRLRQVMPKAPRDLDVVLDKLLSREPGDRYQDGETLARDLQRIGDGEPVHIRRQPLVVRAWRRMRKNPVLSGALLTAAILLISTLVLLRVLRVEKGQALISRHQNNLAAIMSSVYQEPGPGAGPPELLHALTGLEVEVADLGEDLQVLRALAAAQEEMPEDPVPAAMRQAYMNDPLPQATVLLAQGRGYEALQLFSAAIDEAVGRPSTDHAARLRLYRLYLGRAVANLTAAVGDRDAARLDLELAIFLRRGASFPKLLIGVLELVDQPDLPAALDELRGQVVAAGPAAEQAAGHLLLTLAGVRRAAGANLLPLSLTYRDRSALHKEARARLQVLPDGLQRGSSFTGLEGLLAKIAESALGSLGQTAALQRFLGSGREILDRWVHPASPLQSWRLVYQALERPTPAREFFGPDGRELPPELQLRGWSALLDLQPEPEFLQLLQPRFEDLRKDHPGLSGLAAVEARLHCLLGSPRALALASAWVAETPDDPGALLCRCRARLGAGQPEYVLDDAMRAVQLAADRRQTVADLRRILSEAEQRLAGDPQAVLPVRELVEAFKEIGS